MNTQLFNYAVEIEKAGSITKAAQSLYMAQPNLSKALKELEEHLGYEIFERSPGGMMPTERGRNFLVRARNILEQLEEMEAIGGGEPADVQRFSISIPRGSYIADGFTDFAAGLDAGYGMEISIQETNSIQAVNNVAYEKFNLGIIRYQSIFESFFLDFLKSKRLCYEPVWEFEYVVVMSKEHPLAAVETVKADELPHYIELSHADIMIPYIDARSMGTQEKAKAAGRHIYVYDRGCQFDLLTRVPSTYMWVSPLPEVYLEQYGLVQRRCRIPNNIYKDVLIRQEGYRLSGLDEAFLEKLYVSREKVSGKEYL